MRTPPAAAHSSSAGNASVAVEGLSRTFGAVRALDSVDLAIRTGEFVALLGPSGCGKTTLLRCIAGLVSPTSGEVLVDGEPITRAPVHKRDLGMVFQSYALFPHMDVGRNIAFGLKMRGVRGAEAGQRVAEALGLVQMAGYERRYPAQLSGGQQQRVALARALVTRPKALLLDEPFGALDAKLRETMQIELRRLQRRLGVTTIFVTHDQQEALGMADRVAVMRAGAIEQFDAPSRIYNEPETPFVAEFIGQANRFEGRLLERGESRAIISIHGSEHPVPARDNPGCRLGDAVIAMVRPERVRIGASGPGPKISLPGRITDRVFVGEKTTLYLDTVIGTVAVAVSNADAGSREALTISDAAQVTWAADDFLIFPGQRESNPSASSEGVFDPNTTIRVEAGG
jgi:putative spermidine/putrescine transport system ATP-binding protein